MILTLERLSTEECLCLQDVSKNYRKEYKGSENIGYPIFKQSIK